jgi:hypothetical protein
MTSMSASIRSISAQTDLVYLAGVSVLTVGAAADGVEIALPATGAK